MQGAAAGQSGGPVRKCGRPGREVASRQNLAYGKEEGWCVMGQRTRIKALQNVERENEKLKARDFY